VVFPINRKYEKWPIAYSQDSERERESTSAVGTDKKAAVAGTESERKVLNERQGTRRRVAVDAGVCKFEIFNDNCCSF